MSQRVPLSAYSHIETYEYRLPNRQVLFEHRRLEYLDPIAKTRLKQFPYYDPAARRWGKPYGADDLIFRLPEILRAVRKGRTIHSVEGEKDSLALVRAGYAATTHHQGAGRMTLSQAAWLRDAKKIVLWMDRDLEHPEVGAYDVARRYNLLMQFDVDPSRVTMVRARGAGNKDAYDHLTAGLTVRRAVRLDPVEVAEIARKFKRSSARAAGYRRG